MSDPKTPIRVPRPVLLISIGAVVIGFAMMLLGGWLGGVTWDEKTHVLMLKTYFSDGWNVSPDALIAGMPDPAYIWGVYVYGPVGELVAHVFTRSAGMTVIGLANFDAILLDNVSTTALDNGIRRNDF